MSTQSVPPVAVTMGDPAGIGGDIILRAWLEHRDTMPPFFAIDDPGRLSSLALRLKLECSIQTISSGGEAQDHFSKALPVLPINKLLISPSQPGTPNSENSHAVIGAIDQAVELTRSGEASALVTNPIHKASLQEIGFSFPGHTEYLGHLAGSGTNSVMMLTGGGLRVVPVTVHMALRDAVTALTSDAIVRCGMVTAAALKTDFGIREPRLAVAALNPHAGEDGNFGTEEVDIISPAISRLSELGACIKGPFPADTLFHKDARQTYDAVLCMYHDQALIPLKTLDFYGGVNVTLGLPFIRTSPDHGTAFDVAGTGTARCDSLVSAIRLAANIAGTRRRG